MKTDMLIQKLARRAKPVKPIKTPISQFGLWLVFSVFCAGAVVVVIGPRADLATALFGRAFFLPIVTLTLLATWAAASALSMSIPGETRTRLGSIGFSIAPLAIGSLLLACIALSPHSVAIGPGLKCVRNVLLISLFPASFLYFLLKAAAPFRPSQIGALAVLGSTALACLATRFICPNDDPLHFLVWHYLPVLGLSSGGLFGGRMIFRRRKVDLNFARH